MYVYCVESFSYIKCYSDCSCRGAIWLNRFATVLFSGCIAVTVECCVWYEDYVRMCGIMLVLRAIFNGLVRNESPGAPMCYVPGV